MSSLTLKKRNEGRDGQVFQPWFRASRLAELHDYLKDKDYSDFEMEKAGMIVKSDKAQTGYYDRFRSRIMFPISTPRDRPSDSAGEFSAKRGLIRAANT